MVESDYNRSFHPLIVISEISTEDDASSPTRILWRTGQTGVQEDLVCVASYMSGDLDGIFSISPTIFPFTSSFFAAGTRPV